MLANLLERTFGRPFAVRDHILRAYSTDGVNFQRDDSWRHVPPMIRGSYMSYYVCRDAAGGMWYRSSVRGRGEATWHTELVHAGRRYDLRALGIEVLLGPCWCAGRLYGVAPAADGRRAAIACLSPSGDSFIAGPYQHWEGLEAFAVVEDLCVRRVDDGSYVAMLSAGSGSADIALQRWTSTDGNDWRYRGVALQSPHHDHWYRVANNPCLVELGDHDWRLYYRTGREPALGNVIRSARSNDLVYFETEPGERMAPEGEWASHGVGFPFVFRGAEAERWTMYYSGYWGRSRAAGATARAWREQAVRMREAVTER